MVSKRHPYRTKCGIWLGIQLFCVIGASDKRQRNRTGKRRTISSQDQPHPTDRARSRTHPRAIASRTCHDVGSRCAATFQCSRRATARHRGPRWCPRHLHGKVNAKSKHHTRNHTYAFVDPSGRAQARLANRCMAGARAGDHTSCSPLQVTIKVVTEIVRRLPRSCAAPED